jgi:tetratricopeptide (TPR) repeat protein
MKSCMPSLRTTHWVWVIACGLLLGPGNLRAADEESSDSEIVDTRPSPEVEFQIVQNQILALGLSMKTLATDYTNVKIFKGDKIFAERLTDSEVLFLLKDYQRSCFALHGLVNDPMNRNEQGYPKALYYMAESQFQTGNFVAAKRYFGELIERGDKTFLIDSIRRLVEIADMRHQWEGLEKYFDLLRNQGNLAPAVVYSTVKSLLKQNKPELVPDMVNSVDPKHFLYPKIRYFYGVALIELSRAQQKPELMMEAAQVFEELTRIADTFPDAADIKDLAAMNRARILLETGMLTESKDSYQFIARNSPYFEEAMYEVTWAYVEAASRAETMEERVAEYRRALNTIEILLVSVSDARIAAEARILMGNIYIWLGRFNEALDVFSQVTDKYSPIRDDLTMVQNKMVDPVEYYEELAVKSETGSGYIPEMALEWASEEQHLQEAMAVVSDLDDAEKMVNESSEIVENMLKMLSDDENAAFFPGLQPARARTMELENSLVTVTKRLLEVERRLVLEHLSPERRKELELILAERERLEPDYQNLPKSQEDYESRAGRMRVRMKGVQKEAFRLQWSLEEQRRELVGLRRWLNANPDSLPFEDEAIFRSRVQQIDQQILEMETLQKGLVQDIKREQTLVSVTTAEAVEEDELRARYEATLAREREILSVGQMYLVGKNIAGAENTGSTMRVSNEMKDLIAERKLIDAKKAGVQARLKDARQQVYKFRWTLMDQKREVARIRKWIKNNPEFVADKAANSDFRVRLDEVASVIEQLLSSQDGFEKEVVRDEVIDVVMLALKAEEDELDIRYQQTFERERDLLMNSGVNGEDSGLALVLAIEKSRSDAARLNDQLLKFKTYLKEAGGTKAREMKVQLAREQRAISDQYKALTLARGNAKRLVGEIAAVSIAAVQKRFQNIVMRGDVGILDVAWQLKELQTKDIETKLAEQRRELKQLDEQFKSVLEE